MQTINMIVDCFLKQIIWQHRILNTLRIQHSHCFSDIKKKNKLPSRHDLANVIIRNDELKLSTIPFVKTEMIGYHDDLMWNIWDYAHGQGYFVYNNAT